MVTWKWYGLSLGTAVQLVAPVDPHRAYRRLVAQAETGGVEDLPQVDVGHARVHGSDVGEGRERQGAAEVVAQLEAAEEQGIPAGGHELSAAPDLQGSGEVGLEAARSVVPAGEEPLGQRKLDRFARPEGRGETHASRRRRR